MITNNSHNEIRNWFEENGEMEFELPDRYFGRPGDNLDILEEIGIVENYLVIKLGTIEASRKFIFNGELHYQFIDDCLEISRFDLLNFEWQTVCPTVLHSKTYDSGSVRFIPHSKYVPLGWNL
jgi:hypothetical protein